MDLDRILRAFVQSIADIEQFRTLAENTSKTELLRYAELASDDRANTDQDFPSYMSNESSGFYDLETGTYRRFSSRTVRATDRIRQIVKQKNRQYSWFLVEAYEEFEDFLERSYAWIGHHDWQSWRLGEFGNIQYSELASMPFSWYVDAVKRKFASDPKRILSRLRDLYPSLAEKEVRNHLNRNMQLMIELIAKLRHKIVHSRGNISDRNEFVMHVLTSCGLWNNGNPKVEHRSQVEQYLLTDNGQCYISVIEVAAPLPRNAPPEARNFLNPHFDIVGSLISDLVAEAHQIHFYLSTHSVTQS